MKTKKLRTEKTHPEEPTKLYLCGACRGEYPATDFYTLPNARGRDCYCKACRCAISHGYHLQTKSSQKESAKKSYPLITDPNEAPEVRMALLTHATHVVQQRFERQRARMKQAEYDAFR